MDIYITLRFHYGGKLQKKPRIKYNGGTVTDCFRVDVDKLSYFELVDYVKEIGYNCACCVVYIRPPKCRHIVEIKSDKDILGIVPQLKNGDIVQLYLTHLIEEPEVVPPSLEYVNDGESNPTFNKESGQLFEGSENLNFEESAQPQEPVIGEESVVGEECVVGQEQAEQPVVAKEQVEQPAVAGEQAKQLVVGEEQGEELGGASGNVREDLGETFAAASEVPIIGSDWESQTEASEESDCLDLSDEEEDQYDSDVHEEVRVLRKERKAAKAKKKKEKGPRSEGVDLGKKGVDLGYDEYLAKKQTTLEGKIGGDEPYFDSDEAASFELETDEDVDGEDVMQQPVRGERKARRAKKNKHRIVFDPSCQSIVWETGLAFESAKQFRQTITRYAVQEHVELDKYVNEATRVRVKCTLSGCPWLLFASHDSRTRDFVVKNYNPVHKCSGTTKNKLVNSKYISEKYKERIISQPGIRVFELQNLVRKELNVYIGRTRARKARNIVLQQIMGDHVEEFKRILDYRDELLRTNPGSTCVVRLSEETFDGGRKKFQSFYICFDAVKKAFKAGCRRCIGLDGCFLKGVTKGQLLVAVCKDGNNQMLPLAWAVVEVENTFTWSWFIKLLRDDLELGDGSDLTTISDMQKGLDTAVQEFLPNAEQRMCARHILANWSRQWKGIERRNCFWRCAKSTFEQELKRNLDHMANLGRNICEDLLWYNIEKWPRVYFKYSSCCDSVDNNMAESFNSWIMVPRHKTIITMLEEIRVKVMRRIGQLREFCDTWITNISPMALKVLQENTTKSMKCDLEWNGEYGFEVKDSLGNIFVLNLNTRTCTCRSWMLRGIPCCHAIAALHFRRLEPIDYVAHWYNKDTYLRTYSYFIQPVTNMQMWLESSNPSVIPPDVRILPGRPKKCRRKEQNENKTGKLSKKGVEMTCSICHAKGHNKRGCHLSDQANKSRGEGRSAGTSSTKSSVGSSVALDESVLTTKRSRGRPVGSTKQATTVTTSITGRGRGVTERGRGTGVAVDVGVTGRGRGTPFKRPKMVGMGVLHTQSGFTIHNPGMPMNSSVVTGNLGQHKPRSGVKWKGKAAVTQHGLQEMREQKRRRTISKSDQMNDLSQSSSTFQ